jgi:hypothetical protein
MLIRLRGKEKRRQNLPPLLFYLNRLTGKPARSTHILVSTASTSAAAAAAAASAISAAAAAASAAVATAAAASATSAGAIFTGLGYIDGQGSALMVLAVESGDRRLRLGLRGHLDESKALGAAGIAVGDHFGGLDCAM